MEMHRVYTALFFFSHDKHGEKWVECVSSCRWALEDCGVEEGYLVCPMRRKSVKFKLHHEIPTLSH